MPKFSDHINQAKSNLTFLETISNDNINHWDWKVTVCFYATVHLVNAHIVKQANLHYRTHFEVENAINFAEPMAIAKVPQDVFLAYRKLKSLSRRSRYLVHDSEDNKTIDAQFTFDVHFARAIKNLTKILQYINDQHGEKFRMYNVNCIEVKDKSTFFNNTYK